MRKISLAFSAGIFTASLIMLSHHDASAIPAFARKYETSCMTCHAPFPRLSAVGEAFRLNGYKLPNDELYVKDKPVDMGAEAYKEMFPNSVWPSNIPGMPPISVLVNSNITSNFDGPNQKKTTFNLPSDASIIAAGTLGGSVSFFTELAFDNADSTSSVNAWLMYQGLGSKIFGDNHLNVKIGTVGDQEIGLPNARNPNRISFSDYLYHQALNLDNRPGIELNGFGNVWRYALGVVESDTNQDKKDFYAAFSLKFGGVGYGGKTDQMASQDKVTSSPTGYWRDDSVQMGVFAYRGYEYVDADNADTYDRFGGDIRFNYADLSLTGGYAYGKDKSKFFTDDNPKQNIWFGEADYFFFPWMMGYCRYESLRTSNTDNSDINYSDRTRFVPGLVFLVRANVKATIEGQFYTMDDFAEAAGHDSSFNNNMSFALSWAY